MAEAMSAVTCEVCGNPGKLVGGGWVRTLCETHAEEQNYEWVEDKE
jgi:proline racemase